MVVQHRPVAEGPSWHRHSPSEHTSTGALSQSGLRTNGPGSTLSRALDGTRCLQRCPCRGSARSDAQLCDPTLVRPTGIGGSRTVRLSRNSDEEHPVAGGLRVLISCDDVRREEQNPQDEACNEPHGGCVDLKGADGKGDGSSPFGSLPCIGVDPEICPDDDEQHDDGNPRHPTNGSCPSWVHSNRARHEPRRRVGWE